MKTLRSFVVLVLVLGALAIPSLAQESEIDSGGGAGGLSPQLWEIVYGRDGFSGGAGGSGMGVGLATSVWDAINGRDGFDFYASASGRPEAAVNGMPTELWDFIASRDGFDAYATDTALDGSSDLVVTKPAGVQAALWEIIHGRGGFDSSSDCAVC
jgi:hypothetical protein